MKATIWHNPKCGTSRNTLAILKGEELEVTIIEYLKEPPTKTKLRQLFADAGLSSIEALRRRGTNAEQRGLVDADPEAVLDAMAKDPSLVERPFVETPKGVRLCRPKEKVFEII